MLCVVILSAVTPIKHVSLFCLADSGDEKMRILRLTQ
jgi:hypothetical protein